MHNYLNYLIYKKIYFYNFMCKHECFNEYIEKIKINI
jgi:hypothetical protein